MGLNRHVVLTGGAGFIGAHMARLLLDRGYKVTIVDKLTYASNRANVPTEAKLFVEDINNYGFIKDLFFNEPIHYVVNMAAESAVDKSNQGGIEFVRTNIDGVHVLLEAIRSFSPSTRLVQVSTDEVLGHLAPNDPPFNDESPIEPRNFYSATKASAEHLVRAYVNTHGANAIITRCTNNFGPGQHNEKLIPRVVAALKSKFPIPVYGKGDQIRDWIYVKDHCEGILLAMEKGKAGSTYMFGGDNELTNLSIINKLIAVAAEKGLGSVEELSKLISHVDDRPGHDMRYAVDSSKAKAELGWNNNVELFNKNLSITVESML